MLVAAWVVFAKAAIDEEAPASKVVASVGDLSRIDCIAFWIALISTGLDNDGIVFVVSDDDRSDGSVVDIANGSEGLQISSSSICIFALTLSISIVSLASSFE